MVMAVSVLLHEAQEAPLVQDVVRAYLELGAVSVQRGVQKLTVQAIVAVSLSRNDGLVDKGL